MKKILPLLFAFLALFCLFRPTNTDVAYAEETDTEISIVIPQSALSTERYAAMRLQSLLHSCTSLTYPIVSDDQPVTGSEISVGNTNRTEKRFSAQEDGFLFSDETESCLDGSYRIFATASGIAILGAGTRGTIYGVYGLMEKYAGARFYSVNTGLTFTERTFSLTEDMHLEYNAYFEYTDTDWVSPRDTEYSFMNGLSGGAFRTMKDAQGGTVSYVNGFCHTLSTIYCSADRYFDEHPEYFALHDGKRTPSQLCLTNEKTFEIVRDEVLSVLALQYDPSCSLQIISLTQNDNFFYCECDKCKQMDEENNSHAGTNVYFANRVAREVKAAGYENVAIDTFAYQYTRTPPTKVVPDDNVIIRLCTIECCFSHPLNDETCELNAALKSDLEGWSKICDRIYVWDYATNYSETLGIFPDFGVLQANMQFFYEHNVSGVYEEGNYYMSGCDGEFGELRAYLLSKLMQNPYLNYSATMDEFLVHYYGADAAPYLRAFIDGITAESALLHVPLSVSMERTLQPSAETIDVWNGYWASAKEKTTDKDFLERIGRSELCWRFWKFRTQTDEFAEHPISAKFELVRDMQAYGIERLCEGVDLGKIRWYHYLIPYDAWLNNRSDVFLVFFLLGNGYAVFVLLLSVVLFVLGLVRKKYLYCLHLPLTVAMFFAMEWASSLFIAWESVPLAVFSFFLIGLLFAAEVATVAYHEGKRKLIGAVLARSAIAAGIFLTVLIGVLALFNVWLLPHMGIVAIAAAYSVLAFLMLGLYVYILLKNIFAERPIKNRR